MRDGMRREGGYQLVLIIRVQVQGEAVMLIY